MSGPVSRRRIIINHYVKYNSCSVHINWLCLCLWCGVLAICSSFCIGSSIYIVCYRDSSSLQWNIRCFPCLHCLFYLSWIILETNKSMAPPVREIDSSCWIISTLLLYRKEADPIEKGHTFTYHCFILFVWHYLRICHRWLRIKRNWTDCKCNSFGTDATCFGLCKSKQTWLDWLTNYIGIKNF